MQTQGSPALTRASAATACLASSLPLCAHACVIAALLPLVGSVMQHERANAKQKSQARRLYSIASAHHTSLLRPLLQLLTGSAFVLSPERVRWLPLACWCLLVRVSASVPSSHHGGSVPSHRGVRDGRCIGIWDVPRTRRLRSSGRQKHGHSAKSTHDTQRQQRRQSGCWQRCRLIGGSCEQNSRALQRQSEATAVESPHC